MSPGRPGAVRSGPPGAVAPRAETRDAAKADRAKDACLTAVGLNALLVLAGDVLDLGGVAWELVRAPVAAVSTVALVLWVGFRLRSAGRPAPRAWIPAVLLALAVLGVAVGLGELVGDPGAM